MTEPWVVTYRIEHAQGFILFEAYRGEEGECRRIADQSASPSWHEGRKVTGFKVIIGTAKSWDNFLSENE